MLVIWENIYARETFRLLFSVGPGKKKKCTSVKSTEEVLLERKFTDDVLKGSKMDQFSLVFSNLHKCYDNVDAVKNLNFTVKKGK